MSRAYRRLASLCALVWWLGACSGGGARREGEPAPTKRGQLPPPELRLLLLSDPAGVLEPCGCTSRPLGGVDRLVSVAREAASDGVPTVLLAAGDLFTGAPEEAKAAPPGEGQEAYLHRLERWRRGTFAEALRRAGLRAASWGASDALLEEEERAELSRRLGDAVVLSSSVQETIVRVQALQVGVMAVTEGAELRAVEALAASLRRRKADVVVALVTARRPRLARRVAALRDVDLALAAGMHARSPWPPDEVEGGLFVHAGRHLQGVAMVELHGVKERGAWRERGPWRHRVQRERLERRIAERKERLRAWQAEGRPAEQLREQRERLAAMEADLAALRRGTSEAAAPPARWSATRWVELGPEIGSDRKTRESLDALARRINEANREAFASWLPPQPSPGEPFYVGAERCGSCHTAALRWWRGTPHGRAYATLQRRHKEFHLECVGCHVTGYGAPGGSTVTHLNGLQDVGCEVCHGPGGGRHAEDPGRWPPERGRRVPEQVCVGCHNEEHSDRFDYRVYLPRLRAPGHGLPTSPGS